jgi:energy-coupling factor transporter ATP-binding protein EcfA2
VAGVSSLGVVVLGPFRKGIKARYETRVRPAEDARHDKTQEHPAEDARVETQVPTEGDEPDLLSTDGFRTEYLKHLEYRHRTSDVKGLSATGPQSVELQQVFVELSLIAQAQPKTASNPFPAATAGLPAGRRAVWEFLKSEAGGTRNLVIIGAPGSGKTTLLKHMALTLTAGKRHCEQKGVPYKLPLLLSLRDHAERIRASADYPLVQAVLDALTRFDGPTPPTPDWFEQRLAAGECLILLDGLDEVVESATRNKVVEWIEKQIADHASNQFVVSSRPGGYQANPIQGVNVVEMVPFSRDQQERFVTNWYLANEMLSRQKSDEGVRLAAREGAKDLLNRIRSNKALADLAANPLLLTLIATVYRDRSSLPGRRVELYSETCEVLPGKHRATTGLPEDLTSLQQQQALQSLAYGLMRRETCDVTVGDAATILKDTLLKTSRGNLTPETFLRAIEQGSGLLLEREPGRYSFAHLTFQEYLAAAHALEQTLETELREHVDEPWWQEVIRFYCAKAADATSVLVASVESGSRQGLALALECDAEGGLIQPEVRDRVRAVLIELVERADPERGRPAAETLLTLRLRRLVRVNKHKYVDSTLITHAEYQLFLDEMRAQGKDLQPDHWKDVRFSSGAGPLPVVGVRSSDAEAFCKWLSERENTTWRYRLPEPHELDNEPLQEKEEVSECPWSGYWTLKEGKATLALSQGDSVLLRKRIIEYLACDLDRDLARDLDRARERDLAFDRERDPDLTLNRDIDLDLARDRALDHALDHAPDRDRALDRVRVLAPGRTLALDLALDLDRAHLALGKRDDVWWNIYVTLMILRGRREGALPALEGVRIVKEQASDTKV